MRKQRKLGKNISQQKNYKKSLKRALKVSQNKIKKEAVVHEENEKIDDTENKTEEKNTSNLKHTNSTPYDCNFCGKTIIGKTNFDRHVDGIHLGVKYDCDRCDYKAKQKTNLIEHINNIHEHLRYQCEHCDYNSQRKNHVVTHCINTHKITPSPSDISRKKFPPTTSGVSSPKIAKKITNRKDIHLSEFYCDFCSFETDENENALTNHLVLKHYDEVSGY